MPYAFDDSRIPLSLTDTNASFIAGQSNTPLNAAVCDRGNIGCLGFAHCNAGDFRRHRTRNYASDAYFIGLRACRYYDFSIY